MRVVCFDRNKNCFNRQHLVFNMYGAMSRYLKVSYIQERRTFLAGMDMLCESSDANDEKYVRWEMFVFNNTGDLWRVQDRYSIHYVQIPISMKNTLRKTLKDVYVKRSGVGYEHCNIR